MIFDALNYCIGQQIGGFGLVSQEQGWLDQFEFHHVRPPIDSHCVDSSVRRLPAQDRHQSIPQLSQVYAHLPRFASSAVVGLNSIFAWCRRLHDGMAYRAGYEDG
jgi:hypothetical protein